MKDSASVGLGYYLFVLRRQWVTILATTLICVVAVAAYVAVVPGNVVATTAVNVNVIVSDPFNPSRPASGLLDTATEAKLATSYVVAAAAAKTLNSTETPNELREGVSVATVLNGTIVIISYAAPTEQRARAGADAVADAYLAYRQSNAENTKKKMIGNLEEQLNALNKTLAGMGLADKSALNIRISNVEYQINQLTTIDTNGGSVISPATENTVVTKPQPSLLIASGLLVGLVLGIILAFAFNAAAKRVRDANDVASAGAGPVLMSLDYPKGDIPPRGDELVSYRSLRERLLASTESDFGVLAVIDESVTWADSDVGPALAVVLAQAGHDVELVLMGATPEQQERMKAELQLTPAASDPQDDPDALVSTLIPALSVVYPASNTDETNTDEYVTDAVRQRVQDRLPGVIVVLGLPRHAAASSRLAVARLSHSALVVAQLRRTANSTLAVRAQEFADVNTEYHGVVLVRVSRKTTTPPHGTSPEESTISEERQPVGG